MRGLLTGLVHAIRALNISTAAKCGVHAEGSHWLWHYVHSHEMAIPSALADMYCCPWLAPSGPCIHACAHTTLEHMTGTDRCHRIRPTRKVRMWAGPASWAAARMARLAHLVHRIALSPAGCARHHQGAGAGGSWSTARQAGACGHLHCALASAGMQSTRRLVFMEPTHPCPRVQPSKGAAFSDALHALPRTHTPRPFVADGRCARPKCV